MQLTNMAEKLGALLKESEQNVAVAESSSGGLVSAALLSIPGASAYFAGGGVIYTRDARREFLELPEDVDLPVRIFVIWLVLLMWKRDSDNAASSGSG